MSNYDQPATWGRTSSALGKPVLVQVASQHLQPGEELRGVFDLELDQLLPLDGSGTDFFDVLRDIYRAIRQMFHGSPWSGDSGTAGKLWKVVRASADLSDYSRFVMALTDRRMLILSLDRYKTKLTEPYDAKLLMELPSGTYALRPNSPKSAFTYRFDLTFNDGTWIALISAWKDRKRRAEDEETLRQITSLLAA